MMTYQNFCDVMTWPAAVHFAKALQGIIAVGQERVFLASETNSTNCNTYDVIIMDDYKFVEARLNSHDDIISQSNANIKVHWRSDVAINDIDLGVLNLYPPQGYEDMHMTVTFKDNREPLQIDAKKFKLSQEDFQKVVSSITR